MSFYHDWLDNFKQKKNCNNYILRFLKMEPISTAILINGNGEDLRAAYEVLTMVPIKSFIDVLLNLRFDRAITKSEILQYSSFRDGANRIPELLEFFPDGGTFANLGYQLVSAKDEAANCKYGENHSKLAEALNLVTISDSRPRCVKNTAWGSYLVQYSFEEKKELYKKLLLRKYYLQYFLNQAFQGPVSYFSVVSMLAESTATRRRSNTRQILEAILLGTECECYLSNIMWN